MFCYNCGNRVESTSECPFCHKILPPLNRTLEENSLRILRERENETTPAFDSDDGEFVPGELPIYEKYYFAKKRTLFGLFGLFKFILELLRDSDSDFDVGLPPTFSRKDFWQATFSIVTIHRNKIILKQKKKFWIFPVFYKAYGRKNKVILIDEVNAVVQKADDLLSLQFGVNEFLIPTSDKFDPESFVYNLKAANPRIRFTGMSTRR